VQLLVVGDGPERRELEAQAQRLGLGGRVVFAGQLDHAHVVDALFASDLFVFPSQTETLGLAVLEAMAAGRAVVAVRGGAVAEIVREGETGRVVAPDPGALRAAIADLVRDADLRRTMGERARAAASLYGQGRVLDQLLAVYEDVLAARNTPAPTVA
jgi:glycosyltransferase involved in cell wall biosynthesis